MRLQQWAVIAIAAIVVVVLAIWYHKGSSLVPGPDDYLLSVPGMH